jgi:hypothetical protein
LLLFLTADWSDFYDEKQDESDAGFQSRSGNRTLFPTDAWYAKNGFDTEILLVEKVKCQAELAMLESISRSFTYPSNRFANLSLDDKEMWKLALMFPGTNYTLVPTASAFGSSPLPERLI